MTKIMLCSQDYIRFVLPEAIIFCKSDNYYTDIHLCGGERVMISKSLAKFSKDLSTETFIRVSQSYLVNKHFIRMINKKKREIQLSDHSQVIPFTTSIRELIMMLDYRS